MILKNREFYIAAALLTLSLSCIKTIGQEKKSTSSTTATRKAKTNVPLAQSAALKNVPLSRTSKDMAKTTHHSQFGKLSDDGAEDTNGDVGNRDYLQKRSHSGRLLEDSGDISAARKYKAVRLGGHKTKLETQNKIGTQNKRVPSHGKRLTSIKQRLLERLAKLKNSGSR